MKRLIKYKIHLKLTAFVLALSLLLCILANMMSSTLADNQTTVSNGLGELSVNIADNTEYALLKFKADYYMPENMMLSAVQAESPALMPSKVYILMSDGTVFSADALDSIQYAVNSDEEAYNSYPRRILAGQAADPGCYPAGTPESEMDYVEIGGVKYLANVKEIAGNAAVTHSGRVYTWGGNISLSLGIGSTNVSYIAEEPVRVLAGQQVSAEGIYESGADGKAYLYNIKSIRYNLGIGNSSTYGTLTNSGAVYTWGNGANGFLGNGAAANSSSPVRVRAAVSGTDAVNLAHRQQVGSIWYLYNIDKLIVLPTFMAAITSSSNVQTDNNCSYYWGETRGSTAATSPNTAVKDRSSSTNVRDISYGPYINDINTATYILNNNGTIRTITNEGTIGMLQAGASAQAISDGSTAPAGDFSNVVKLTHMHSGIGLVTRNGRIYVNGNEDAQKDNRMYTGYEKLSRSQFIRMPISPDTDTGKLNLGEHYYMMDGKPYLLLFNPDSTEDREIDSIPQIQNSAFVTNGRVFIGKDYTEGYCEPDEPVIKDYYLRDSVNDVLPLVTMEIYRIKEPEADGANDVFNRNGNRMERTALKVRRDTNAQNPDVEVKVRKNGYYRAYYIIGTELQYYLDVHLTEILDNHASITPNEEEETYNGMTVEYDGSAKSAVINLQSDYKTNNIAGISAGTQHTAVIAADTTVFMWGNQNNGKLGNGVNSNTVGGTPQRVLAGDAVTDKSGNYLIINGTAYLANIAKIFCSDSHTIALAKDGRVYAWGTNTSGQLGIGVSSTTGANSYRSVPVRVRAGEAATTTSLLGNARYFEKLSDGNTYLLNVIDIGVGANNSGFILSVPGETERRLYVCGQNGSGQLGVGSIISHNLPQRVRSGHIGASNIYTTTGIVYMEPNIPYETAGLYTYPTNIKQVAFGSSHMIVLTDSGNVYASGSNASGQAGFVRFSSTSASMEPASWAFSGGTGTLGTAGYTTTLLYVAANEASRMGICYSWTTSYHNYKNDRLANISYISCGPDYSMAIGEGGVAFAWGNNTNGQLGNGKRGYVTSSFIDGTSTAVTPGTVMNTNANAMCGPVVIRYSPDTSAEKLYNDYSQITNYPSDGNTAYIFNGAVEIYTGADSSVIRKKDGSLYSFGAASRGALGDPEAVLTSGSRLIPGRIRQDITGGGSLLKQTSDLGIERGNNNTLTGVKEFCFAGSSAMGIFDYEDGEYIFAGWGENSSKQLGSQTASDIQTIPDTGLTQNLKINVFSQTNARYILKSYVRKAGEPGGVAETTIDIRTFEAACPERMLNHNILIYENGWYEVEYKTISGYSFFKSVIFTGEEELALYNVKNPGKKQELSAVRRESRMLDAPLKLIDLNPMIKYNFYIRPVYDNSELGEKNSSAVLPHEGWHITGENEIIEETLYIYGPKPSRNPGTSDEEYKYYTLGAELLKIAPDGVWQNGVRDIEREGLQTLYDNGDTLHVVSGTLPLNRRGVYTAVLVRKNKIVDLQEIEIEPHARLYIKQVVTEPNSALVVPEGSNRGFVRINCFDNDGTSLKSSYNKLIESGINTGNTAYTTVTLNTGYRYFRIDPVIPSYYKIKEITIGTAEDSQNIFDDSYYDFTNSLEWYITIYITPSAYDEEGIRPYFWDYGYYSVNSIMPTTS